MKRLPFKILTLCILVGITPYANDNGLGKAQQYTPNQANWKTFETKPFAGGTNTAHDPDAVGWIKRGLGHNLITDAQLTGGTLVAMLALLLLHSDFDGGLEHPHPDE